jgi:hypothetical protein
MKQSYGPAVAMIRREFIEYKGSFWLTPLILGLFLTVVSFGGALFASQFSDWEEGIGWFVASNLPDAKIDIVVSNSEAPANNSLRAGLVTPRADQIIALAPEPTWDFHQSWTFSTPGSVDATADMKDDGPLQTSLKGIRLLFILVLWTVSVNYLAGSFYNDRRDRSVLFWRSMPVSDLTEVLVKAVTIVLVVPIVYLIVVLFVQFSVLASALLFSAMSVELAVPTISTWDALTGVLVDTLFMWPLIVIIAAPLYGFGLFTSAWSKRSPSLLFLGVPIALIVAERLIFRTSWVFERIAISLPASIEWRELSTQFLLSWPEQLLGVGVAGLLFYATARVRQYRLDLS